MKRRERNEDGVALIMAIGVMVMVAAVLGGIVISVRSGFSVRTTLDNARNREYAADAALEYAIANVAKNGNPGVISCTKGPGGTTWSPNLAALNGHAIHIDCSNQSRVDPGTLLIVRNVTFQACPDTVAHDACVDATTIIRAQVNFEVTTLPSDPVHAFVQSWSVNK